MGFSGSNGSAICCIAYMFFPEVASLVLDLVPLTEVAESLVFFLIPLCFNSRLNSNRIR